MCRLPEGAAADGVRLLLAAGADATAKDRNGFTALHCAAMFGPDDPALAGLLMAAECDPAARDGVTGNTALDFAKANNRPRMAALLEAAAADPGSILAPYRVEVAALLRVVGEWGVEAGLAVIQSNPELFAGIRDELEPQILADMLEKKAHSLGRADKAMPQAPLSDEASEESSEESREERSEVAERYSAPVEPSRVRRLTEAERNNRRPDVLPPTRRRIAMAEEGAADLHAAAGQGRLADLGSELLTKEAEGTLAAGTPCRTPPNSPCPRSPAPGLCGGSAGGAGQERPRLHAAGARGDVHSPPRAA